MGLSGVLLQRLWTVGCGLCRLYLFFFLEMLRALVFMESIGLKGVGFQLTGACLGI